MSLFRSLIIVSTGISENIPHFVSVLKSFFAAMDHSKLILKPNKLRYF